jgi:hypothetical protein
LIFDFAILNPQRSLEGLIEYQGEQHYKPMRYNGGDAKFELRQLRDSIKKTYCESNNIPLLIIPYTEYNNIGHIIDNFVKDL